MSRAPQRLREPSPPPLEQTSFERQECLSRRLYGAVARGKMATFEELLAEGAIPNWAHPDDGRTPLHVAAQNGRADFINLLLGAGANIANTDDRGRTALDLFLKGKTCIAGCLFMRKATAYDCLALLTLAHQAHHAGTDFVTTRLAASPPVVAHLAALPPCPGSPPSYDAAKHEYIAVIHPGDELVLARTPGTPRHTARSLGLTRPHAHTV
eukprot:scaffold115845_cov58-Phaeocystis_antarctica.AAC.3